jgi:hypothetical protein
MKILCPEFATFVGNCYAKPARLFITGGSEIASNEGTTQGDPVAMAMYAVGIIPLLQLESIEDAKVKRMAFADDFTGVSTVKHLRSWWDKIVYFGPFIGYFPNPRKSVLIVKEQYRTLADQVFADTEVEITSEGNKHLGACVGDETFKQKHVTQKVEKWIDEVNELSRIALMYPHAAYAAFVQGLQHRYTYTMRTVPKIKKLLEPLEAAIRQHLLPAILNGYECNDLERKLFSLPAKFGGLGIFNPVDRSDNEYANSRRITEGMVRKVCDQKNLFDPDSNKTQQKIIAGIKTQKAKLNSETLENIKINIDDPVKLRTLQSILEKGASNWLTALPIKENSFYLEKQAFWDCLHMRYNIPLKNLPLYCVCGKLFNIDHALSCPRGGFIIIRHNEIRDFTAKLLAESYKNVYVEPDLTPLTGEIFPASTITTDEARVDIAARGVWVKGQMAYFDVRVFNPIAKSYLNSELSSAHRSNEQTKKRSYNKRIQTVDQGSFTPLVFSCYGGMGRECSMFYKRLAEKISEKQNISFSIAINWIRTRLNFHLLRSCLLCLRGSRTIFNHDNVRDIDVKLIAKESNLL